MRCFRKVTNYKGLLLNNLKYWPIPVLCICVFLLLHRRTVQMYAKSKFECNTLRRNITKYVSNKNTTHSDSYGKWRFLVDSEVCKIPDVNPFDPSIKRMLNSNPKVLRCDNSELITYIKNNILHLNMTRKPKELSYCRVKPIFRYGKSFKYGIESSKFNSSILIKDEFLKVQCYNLSDSVIAENFHISFIRKHFNWNISKTLGNKNISAKIYSHEKKYNPKTVETFYKSNLSNKPRPSVLLIMLDSTSRINSLRYMQKTRKYLLQTLGAVEMLGYNKVADNTMVNMVPILTGQPADDLPCLNNKEGVDDCPLVWKKFAKIGYFTHFAEDWNWAGIFHYDMPGFKYQPTDYYDHPFHAANEENAKSIFDICFHGKSSTEHLHNRMYHLAYNLRHEAYFSLSIHSKLTHNSLSDAINTDEITMETLSKLYQNNLLNNTFLAIFGDHGMRFGAVRPTFIGQLEERLPMMFIYVPLWFRTKYPHYVRNLNTNARRLTTHLDLHSTLLHLLDLDNLAVPKSKQEKGISLFQEIPRERSCDDANIISHWCTCNYHTMSVDNSTIQKAIARVLIKDLNTLLKKFEKKCKKLSIMQIHSCFKLLSDGEDTEQHKIVIKTKPGEALFESTVMYNKSSKFYTVVGDVSRVNLYNGQSDCIQDKTLRKMCVCK